MLYFTLKTRLSVAKTRCLGGPAHAKTRLEAGSSWESRLQQVRPRHGSRRHDHDLHLLNTKIPTTPAHFRSPPTRPPLPIPNRQSSKIFVLASGFALRFLQALAFLHSLLHDFDLNVTRRIRGLRSGIGERTASDAFRRDHHTPTSGPHFSKCSRPGRSLLFTTSIVMITA